MKTGTIIWLFNKQELGIIRPDNHGADVFFYSKDLEQGIEIEFNLGQHVSYMEIQTQLGPKAISLKTPNNQESLN